MTAKIVLVALGLAVVAPAGLAQQASDSPFEQGRALYEARCVLCHQASGEGVPPVFPALGGNEQLRDSVRIVSNIHQGTGNMPPFPDLGAEQIASLASYVRNAWGNDFGSLSTEDAAAVLAGLGQAGPTVSIWNGVFTEAQAERGQMLYPGPCGLCHGRRLNGAPDDPDMRSTPPLARARFLRVWDGRSLATLFEYTRATMPEGNPGSMSDQEYIDVIAYMLSFGGLPSGDEELPVDPQELARVLIRAQP